MQGLSGRQSVGHVTSQVAPLAEAFAWLQLLAEEAELSLKSAAAAKKECSQLTSKKPAMPVCNKLLGPLPRPDGSR